MSHKERTALLVAYAAIAIVSGILLVFLSSLPAIVS
jgi:hypothetical protein